MATYHQIRSACFEILMVGLVLCVSPMLCLAQVDLQRPAGAAASQAAALSAVDPQQVASGNPVQTAGYQEPGIIQRSPQPQRTGPGTSAPGELPYRVTTATRVPVRSGPSDGSYITDYLKPGQSVEVYRHDPEGWLAIRPPAGSFSLIKERDTLATRQSGVRQVNQDRVKAWVGTRIEQTHEPISQVRLKSGEAVGVQSSIEVQEGNQREIWLQIDPPAGEFRWVHSSYFSRPMTSQSAIASGDSPSPTGGPASETLDLEETPPLEMETDEPEDQWRAAQRETPEMGYADYAGGTAPDDNSLAGSGFLSADPRLQNVAFSDASTGQPAAIEPQSPSPAEAWDRAVQRLSQNEHGFYQTGQPTMPPTTASASPALPGAQWNQHLNLLNTQLSQEIIKPAPQWSLTPLLQQSQVLIQSAPTGVQREAATALQRRIQGFLQMQQPNSASRDLTAGIGGVRYAMAGNQILPASLPNSNMGSATPSPGQAIPHNYAAIGYLKELILDRGRQPNAYVLQDTQGKTICHITPLPGVQLHQALDKKIGVKGRPGYHAQLRLPHVSVEAFDRLDP